VGRNRSYDEDEVLGTCARAFLQTGYEGTSIDDLVTATGLHRGSIYQAFGSKRGIFVAVLSRLRSAGLQTEDSVDLVLVALLELAPRDAEVRQLVTEILSGAADLGTPESLGARLLARAHIGGAHISGAPVREGEGAKRQ
jgi:AcrR family transcriptional regulator